MSKQHNLAVSTNRFITQHPKKSPEKRIIKLPKGKLVISKKQMTYAVITIIYVTVMCTIMLFKHTNLAQKNSEFLASERTLQEVEAQNTQLSLEMERNFSLKTIEKIAKENLGMVKPNQMQIHYINMDKENTIELEKEKRGLFSIISTLFQYVKGYVA